MDLPEGTVTFLRTDIEGSMVHAQALGSRYDELNVEQQALVRDIVAVNRGQVVRTEGDAFFVVFTEAPHAARAAVDIQRAMAAHDWPAGHELRLRIGIHSGAATRAGDDYGGLEVSRAARIAATGHGGQIVCSDAARALISTDLPDGARLHDLGGHRLAGLPEPEHLFQLLVPGLDQHFGPLRSGGGPAAHLPERMASFIGRERELSELVGLLDTTRLLTLVGPGGAGKTTLAIELARRQAGTSRDGAWFVDLQNVSDTGAAWARLAHDLGLFDGPAGPAVERLLQFVGERDLLLVVDNLEQVPDGAELVGDLLRASPASRIIATSRSPLHLVAEQSYPVQPLALEPEGAELPEAVRLFIQRARKARPDLRLDDADRAAVARICRLVDGLPLAIELCAARVAVMPVARIEERLSRRLPLPGSGPRDLPARQRTIEDTVTWSFDLLDPPLQVLLVRLAVFEGSFELEQAEQVCGPSDELGIDVLDGLALLVERSLLQRIDDPVGGLRFGMLETIRAFARARLDASGEADRLRASHGRAYLALVERILPGHADPLDATWWLDRLGADEGNLEAATRQAITSGALDVALGLVGYLWRYWVHGGRLVRGRELAIAALAMPDPMPPSEARAWAQGAAGSLAYWASDLEAARDHYEAELALATEVGSPSVEGDAWINLMFVRRVSGDEAGATAAAARARDLFSTLSDARSLDRFTTMRLLMEAPSVLADPDAGLPRLARQIEELEASTNQAAPAALPNLRGIACLAAGDIAGAARNLVLSLRQGLNWRRTGDIVTGLSLMGTVGSRYLDPEVAAITFGALDAAIERYGIIGPRWPRMLFPLVPEDPRAEVKARMEPAAYEMALERGQHMTLEDIVAYLELRLDTKQEG